jgi:serralysin
MRYRHDIIPEQKLEFTDRASTGTVGKSSIALADGVLSGYEWSGLSLTYAFPNSKNDYGYKGERDHGFSPVNNKIQNAVERTLDQAFGTTANDGFSIEGFTNLGISEGNDKTADLRYAESSKANPTAYAYYPTGGAISGDVWFGKDPIYDKPVVGHYAFATILHETGHALGLKHGHDATSFDRIKTTLHGKYDSLEYSVMTYHSFPGMKGQGYSNEPFGYPQTYMMADIRALQHMYGADFTTNSGDTEYSWSPGSGNTLVNGAVGISPGANRIFATIWDGGGDDTYNLSAYSQNLSLDLRPGQYSVFRTSQLADLNQFMPGKLAHGNIFNALQYNGDPNSLIENAIGGAGNDRLRGNAADNELTGNGGLDIFLFRTGGGSDTITDFTSGDRINLVGMGLTFAEIETLGSNSGGDFVINFGNGDVLTLVGRTEASLDTSGSDFIFA